MPSMEVIFRRLNDRQYAIGLIRDGVRDVGGDVAVRIAPGGSHVPHDLVHFVVEEQAELTLGIFGQCAAGGDVGGFFRASGGKRGKAGQLKRSRRLGGAGGSQVGRSEELAGLARDGAFSPRVDSTKVSAALRDAINHRLDEVIAQWNRVPVGNDLVLRWPTHLTIRRGQLRLKLIIEPRDSPHYGRARADQLVGLTTSAISRPAIGYRARRAATASRRPRFPVRRCRS